jgi:hypothetical protein
MTLHRSIERSAWLLVERSWGRNPHDWSVLVSLIAVGIGFEQLCFCILICLHR